MKHTQFVVVRNRKTKAVRAIIIKEKVKDENK